MDDIRKFCREQQRLPSMKEYLYKDSNGIKADQQGRLGMDPEFREEGCLREGEGLYLATGDRSLNSAAPGNDTICAVSAKHAF